MSTQSPAEPPGMAPFEGRRSDKIRELERSRRALVDTMHELRAHGLNRGTLGNASCRIGERMLITPSAVEVDDLTPGSMAVVPLGEVSSPSGADGSPSLTGSRPSVEWPLHRAIYARRPDVSAIVHTHSRFATVLACAHRPLRAVHYLMALCGAAEIPVAEYATFGTEDLGRNTAEALADCDACLMANHGMVACADDLRAAAHLARVVEEQAEIYWRCLAVGGGHELTENEILTLQRALAGYGDSSNADRGLLDVSQNASQAVVSGDQESS